MIFAIVSLPGFLTCYLFILYTKDPVRGGTETALAEHFRQGGSYQKKISLETFLRTLKIRSNLILIFQAIPGTIPWGVLFAFLPDFLSQEKKLSVENATFLMTLFGIGSSLGGIGGGIIGQMAYKKSKPLLPSVMAWSTILGTLPMLVMINGSYAKIYILLLLLFHVLSYLVF